MLADASDYHNKQNKWKHQKIHKKYNKMQYASKHYGTSLLIQTRKNPVKQRSDRKKFKAQRSRKKIYKRMAFDYDDFMYQNKRENHKRIQTRPTISYSHKYNTDINTMFTDYYQKYDHPRTETLCSDIPIWQCNSCTYINIERLEFCAMCNNAYKYDYDNHGFDNDSFYKITYVKHKKQKCKKTRNVSESKNPQKNDTYKEFKSYCAEAMESQNEYQQRTVQINQKLKSLKNKTMNDGNYSFIIVLSLKSIYLTNGVRLNYTRNQPIYAAIMHQNQFIVDPIIVTSISHYYPFYEIPVCVHVSTYEQLSKNIKSLQPDLALIVRKVKQQLQPQIFQNNDRLELMIGNHKNALLAVDDSPIDFSKFFPKVSPSQNSKPVEDGPFNVKIDILLHKNMHNTTDNFEEYNKVFSAEIKAVKERRFLLNEVNITTEMDSYRLIFTDEYDRNISIFGVLALEQQIIGYSLPSKCSNKGILNIAEKCVDIIFGEESDIEDEPCESSTKCVDLFDNDDSSSESKDEFKCDESVTFRQFSFANEHIPYYNLLPLSFKISRILYAYIPSMDIISNICVPMIGYNKMYYVTIKTNVRCLHKSKFEKIKNENKTERKISERQSVTVAENRNPVYLSAYARLIEMGFEGNASLAAAKKYPNNMNSAIDWIRKNKAVKVETSRSKCVRYNYDANWEAIALFEEEESESSFRGGMFGADDSSSDEWSSD